MPILNGGFVRKAEVGAFRSERQQRAQSSGLSSRSKCQLASSGHFELSNQSCNDFSQKFASPRWRPRKLQAR